MLMQKKASRNHYKKIENHLKNYRNYKIGIDNMQRDLDYLMPDITANYEVSEGSSGAFVFSSKTENYAIDRIESKRALDLHEGIKLYKHVVESVEAAVDELEPTEQKYINYRYYLGWSVEKTARKLGYSYNHMTRIRESVKNQLCISLRNIVDLNLYRG